VISSVWKNSTVWAADGHAVRVFELVKVRGRHFPVSSEKAPFPRTYPGLGCESCPRSQAVQWLPGRLVLNQAVWWSTRDNRPKRAFKVAALDFILGDLARSKNASRLHRRLPPPILPAGHPAALETYLGDLA